MELYRYNKYSDYLFKKYGEKTYKLPLNIPVTCPNRDGNISVGGCSFCSELGAGFECFDNTVPIARQLDLNKEIIAPKYKVNKFIAYFQNFSNTYLEFDKFCEYMEEAAKWGVCEIAVSTRPDCLADRHIEFLYAIRRRTGVEISVELGLQTANYRTLDKINRGHGLAEFIDACARVARIAPEIEICAHVILNLPGDDLRDVIETAKILSALRVRHAKPHALFLMKGTKMAQAYANGEFTLISANEYIERVITFLEYLSPEITLQRLIGRAPEGRAVFLNWDMSWKRIQNEIERRLRDDDRFQGKKFSAWSAAREPRG